jgi:hypothetical protein
MNSFTDIENLIDYSRDKLKEIQNNTDISLQNKQYYALVSYMIGELDNTLNKMNQEGGRRRRKTRKVRRRH